MPPKQYGQTFIVSDSAIEDLSMAELEDHAMGGLKNRYPEGRNWSVKSMRHVVPDLFMDYDEEGNLIYGSPHGHIFVRWEMLDSIGYTEE